MTNVANDCLFKYGLMKDSVLFSYLEKWKWKYANHKCVKRMLNVFDEIFKMSYKFIFKFILCRV